MEQNRGYRIKEEQGSCDMGRKIELGDILNIHDKFIILLFL